MIDKYLLFPYWAILKLRDRLYRTGRKKSVPAEVPTICVGNIAVGGTGKTPHTEMIIRMLMETEEWGGRHIAVLSRGYKRESKGFQQVTEGGSASMYGDEPLQIKKHFPSVTVAVCEDRILGCRFLCHPEELQTKRDGRKCWDKNFPPADIIILDDAFQYRKLSPSLSIVLVEYSRPLGKDHLLPVGHLRDLPERIKDADVVIATKCQPEIDAGEKEAWEKSLGYALDKSRQTLLFSTVHYDELQPVCKDSDAHYRYAKKAVLFTGIANDRRLRLHLSDSYKIVRHYRFGDHHKFTWSDCHRLLQTAKKFPTAAFITTEKDVQRVLDFAGFPSEVKRRLLAAPVRVGFTSEEESLTFRNMLRHL